MGSKDSGVAAADQTSAAHSTGERGVAVAEVLTKAADLLEKPGAWTQGQLARDTRGRATPPGSPDAICWCAAGALQRVAWPKGFVHSSIFDGAYVALSRSVRRLPAVWNDEPGRTQAEVVAALRKAAEQASAQAAAGSPHDITGTGEVGGEAAQTTEHPILPRTQTHDQD